VNGFGANFCEGMAGSLRRVLLFFAIFANICKFCKLLQDLQFLQTFGVMHRV
jgi:hypothetical protein